METHPLPKCCQGTFIVKLLRIRPIGTHESVNAFDALTYLRSYEGCTFRLWRHLAAYHRLYPVNFIEWNITMAQKFPPGDIVQLKSGGPAMTISSIKLSYAGAAFEGYNCEWFKGASKEQAMFKEETLQAYVAPSKP